MVHRQQERLKKRRLPKHLERLYSKHQLTAKLCQEPKWAKKNLMKRGRANQWWKAWILQSKKSMTCYHSTWGMKWSVERNCQAFRRSSFLGGNFWASAKQVAIPLEAKKKRRVFCLSNTPRSIQKTFIEPSMRTSERSVCIVKLGKSFRKVLLDEVQDNFKYIFNKEPSQDLQWKWAFWLIEGLSWKKIYASFGKKDEDTFTEAIHYS